MKMEKKGLGKGLKELFGETAEKQETVQRKETPALTGDVKVSIALIEPNGKQPRKNFDGKDLDELAESIRQNGVLQPLIVQKNGAVYKIIAGERRWRAAQAAGLKEVPVVIREYTPQQAAEISIIENVQRADLNPVEEAKAYQMLMDDYKLTQEEIAGKVSKNRTTITNALRLLRLSEKVQNMMIDGTLSSGHARALLSLERKEDQEKTADEIIARGLSVRETEKIIKAMNAVPKKKKKEQDNPDYTLYFREYEEKMKDILNTKVRINRKDKNKGRIEVDYYSMSELERIMDLLRTIRH